jgi:hypothetical protein
MLVLAGSISIPSFRIEGNDDVVWYFVRAKIGLGGDANHSIAVAKRYSHFVQLYEKLKDKFVFEKVPEIPPKKNKVLFNHTKKDFAERRRILLEMFLKKVAENQVFAESKELAQFFESDDAESKAIQTIIAEGNEEERAKNATKTAKFFFEEHYLSEEVSDISIPAVQHMSDHTLFRIMCRNGDLNSRSEHNEWMLLKRFLDFCELDDELRKYFSKSSSAVVELLPPLPLKASKMMTDHRDPKFVEERRLILENYLKKIIHIREVVNHPSFLRFINAGI